MIYKARLTALVTALGITMTVALLASPIARAEDNPFSVTEATKGVVVAADEGKCGDSSDNDEGKCGDSGDNDEGKCGDSGDDSNDDDAASDEGNGD